MRRRKAAGPAAVKANGPHAVSQAGEPRDREANASSRFCPLAVYDGTAFVGSIVERAGAYLAIDLHDRLIGKFANLPAAMRAIPLVQP